MRRSLIDTTPVCARSASGGPLARLCLDSGLPNATPDLTCPFGVGVEMWGVGPVQQLLLYPPSGSSLRQPFSLPPGPQQFTLQFVSLMSSPLCGAQALAFAASPALMVSYP